MSYSQFMQYISSVLLFFFFFLIYLFLFFLIATRRTLLYKTRRTLLTIPPTRRYLFYLLYNTSLDCNSYPTFYSFFFFAYTPMYLLNYNSKWVSIQPRCYSLLSRSVLKKQEKHLTIILEWRVKKESFTLQKRLKRSDRAS